MDTDQKKRLMGLGMTTEAVMYRFSGNDILSGELMEKNYQNGSFSPINPRLKTENGETNPTASAKWKMVSLCMGRAAGSHAEPVGRALANAYKHLAGFFNRLLLNHTDGFAAISVLGEE